ncbi:T9SS type A sorting domain-containing protein [Soonwooa sp.]|uniref:T9SS type A sorting domain-containing protein n=1 Tax=Soonwooa sp. TaxID=1938592 RepID=UPI002896758D|nr:T9SS type A sorting domain-containing protein [Soonwooa sp.]
MKTKLFFPLALLLGTFSFAQNQDLLNTNWEITEYNSEFFPQLLPPAMTGQNSTHFDENSQKLVINFFNSISLDVTFPGQNVFMVNSKACTLADYPNDNGQVNQFFGFLCNFFNVGDNYHYYIQNNGSEKTMTFGSPIFEGIHFKEAKLSTNDKDLSKYSFGPNPVKNVLNIQNQTNISTVQIFDLSGKLILELNNQNSKSLNIDMTKYKSGTYLVKINDNKAFKIIKD